MMKETPLSELNFSDFSAQIDTKFVFFPETLPPVELTLRTAKPWALGRCIKEDEAKPPVSFSLVFLGPPKPFLSQQMYRVEHPVIGAFPLFIVPVGKRPEGFLYEAVFNRGPG